MFVNADRPDSTSVISPVMSPDQDTRHVTHRTHQSVGTQTEQSIHDRRWIFQPNVIRLTVFRPDERREYSDDGMYIDKQRKRRICDCEQCIKHQLDLLKYDIRHEQPAVPGIRCVNLPGLGCPVSTNEDQQQLDRMLKERPAATYVVCGCERCRAHRNLLRAHREALRVTPHV